MEKDKISKEWEKIKNFNIFCSFEEFAKLFDKNPNGSCFKKYTNYQWCKENFFFGTYNELLEFYKTSTEVPFYLNKMIDKKFGQLTIKSFTVKFDGKKRKYYAYCKCDCGKECEKEYSKILEGHVTTCGTHKQKHKTDLLSNYKDIVEKYWDYEKNDTKPENVSIYSERPVWWLDETGSFQLKPSELRRKTFGTSFNEQCIYFYLSKIFKNVYNRKKLIIENNKYEVDIYLADYKIAIEYDGVFWHKGKILKDIEKTKKIAQSGINVIHIRENGLQFIETDKSFNLMYDLKSSFSYVINELCKLIFDIISKNINLAINSNELEKLLKFHIDEETFVDDAQVVVNQYRTNYIEDNLAKTCLIKYWDYDKNKIIPQKVSVRDNICIYLKCPYGLSDNFDKSFNIKTLAQSITIKCENPSNCIKCPGFYCPLWTKCVKANMWIDYYNYSSVFLKLCPQMKKFFYYKIFIERKENKYYYAKIMEKWWDIRSSKYEKCVGKKLNLDNNFQYNLVSIYKKHRQDLLKSDILLDKVKAIFNGIILSTKDFDDLSHLSEFLEHCNPCIEDINYNEFDVDNEHRQFVLKVIDKYEVKAHNWERYKDVISNNFFENIKNRLSHLSIELSTKVFTLEELRKITRSYNPKISNVVFQDFSNSTEARTLLVEALSKTPFFSGMFNDAPYKQMHQWEMQQLDIIIEKTDMKKIELNENNIFEYLNIIWKQRKNCGIFGLNFKKKNPNTFIKIDSLEIDFSDDAKKSLHSIPKNTPKVLTPDIEHGFQQEIFLGGKGNPIFKEFPFHIKNIKGFVISF